MQNTVSSRTIAVAGILSSAAVAAVHGQAIFAVDPNGSQISISGTALGLPIQPQGPGSLTTRYTGNLPVQLTPNTIFFPGGGSVVANNSGNWQPLPGGEPGAAPANYGAQQTVLFVVVSRAAVRNTVFDVTTSSPLPLSMNGNSGSFSAAADFTATAGTIDFNSQLVGFGSQDFTGAGGTNEAQNPATLTIAPAGAGSAQATLVSPVQFHIEAELKGFGQAAFDFTGNITARATTRAGDANFDGLVNLTDFNALAGNFGSTGANWLRGDFNFDGNVNLADFNALAGNFGTSARPDGPTADDWATLAAAIPEPALLGVIALAAPVALRRRRPSA